MDAGAFYARVNAAARRDAATVATIAAQADAVAAAMRTAACNDSGEAPHGKEEKMTEQYATPLVRKLAAQHNVDLAEVTGTGVSGRITPADVRAAAVASRTDPDGQQLARECGVPAHEILGLDGSGPNGKITREDVSAHVTQRVVREIRPVGPSASSMVFETGPYASNPLVAKARAERPLTYQAATTEGPTPTLFATGDLPVFMVSGADPSLLLKLPWQVRHAAARASASELADIFERYAGPDDAVIAELDFAGHHENRLYEQRVNQWLDGPALDWTKPRSTARQAADAETYELLFGEEDRRKAKDAALAAEEREAQKRFESESLALAQERAKLR